jgi:hypothetical protein
LALEIVLRYFESIEDYNSGKKDSERFSSCAGIAVFHAHAPFAKVYEIAEECCENCKAFNRKNGNNSFWFDFQFVLGGIANNLKRIRENEEAAYTNRPYCFGSALRDPGQHSESKSHSYPDQFLKLAEVIINSKMRRGDIKKLTKYMFDGESYFEIEIKRQIAKHKNEDLLLPAKDKKTFAECKKTFYDLSLCYDIWIDTIKKEVKKKGAEQKCQK